MEKPMKENLERELIREEKQIVHEGHKATREIKKLEKIINKLRRVEIQEFTNYLQSPWRIFWANFLAGTARGLGFILGVTLIVTIVGLVITKVLSQIPVVGDFFQAINIWIQHAVQTSKELAPHT